MPGAPKLKQQEVAADRFRRGILVGPVALNRVEVRRLQAYLLLGACVPACRQRTLRYSMLQVDSALRHSLLNA